MYRFLTQPSSIYLVKQSPQFCKQIQKNFSKYTPINKYSNVFGTTIIIRHYQTPKPSNTPPDGIRELVQEQIDKVMENLKKLDSAVSFRGWHILRHLIVISAIIWIIGMLFGKEIKHWYLNNYIWFSYTCKGGQDKLPMLLQKHLLNKMLN